MYEELLKKEDEVKRITDELFDMGFKSTGPKAFAKKLNAFNEEAARESVLVGGSTCE